MRLCAAPLLWVLRAPPLLMVARLGRPSVVALGFRGGAYCKMEPPAFDEVARSRPSFSSLRRSDGPLSRQGSVTGMLKRCHARVRRTYCPA